ncbi:MAG: CotH kinase family protein [Lachnospiraceae bacterium]
MNRLIKKALFFISTFALPALAIPACVKAATQAEQAGLPVVTLTIDESQGTIEAMNADPEHDTKCYGTFTLTLPDGYVSEYGISEGYEGTMSMKGRGSSSWGWAKKPYQVTLDAKTDLLGMGKAKKWTLIANYADRTLMRNKLLYDLADDMGLPFSAKSVFVEVEMNGEYLGNYILCEKVEVKENRVDIGDDGFLIEKNGGVASFRSSLNYAFEIGNPDPPTDEETEYITSYYNAFEQAVFADGFYNTNGQYYDDLVDFDSLVNYYILTELSKEVDVMHKSVYFYKSREAESKMFIGPVWDFDRSLGNSAVNDCNVATGFYAANRYLWQGITKDKTFMDAVIARYAEIYPLIQELYADSGTIDTYYNTLKNSANFEVWDINTSPGSALVSSKGSYEAEVSYMKSFLKERAEWLNNNLQTLQSSAINRGEVVLPDPDTVLAGQGTKERPYLIQSNADFKTFTNNMLSGTTYAGKYLRQTVDLDLSGYAGYEGIGSNGTFSGYYDGNGHTINVTLSGTDPSVFPYVYGTIINLGVTGSITNTSHTGALCRSLRVDGKIINCYTNVAASTTSGTLGGIAASTETGESYVINCYVAGSLSGVSGKTGAIFGNIRDGIIVKNCFYLESLPMPISLTGASALSAAGMQTEMSVSLNNYQTSIYELSGIGTEDLCTFTNVSGSYPILQSRQTGIALAGRILDYAASGTTPTEAEITAYDFNGSNTITAVDALLSLK